ncbi:MAG: hypothetical protein K2P27_03670, partial [Lachnospiraceae bacterium]|nr:hypothetical protein [Lachnospiraceae bacterium]
IQVLTISSNEKRKKPMKTENLQSDIHTFIAAYGKSALREAMQQYIDDRQTYICRAKSHIARIPIRDICYLEIVQHNHSYNARSI